MSFTNYQSGTLDTTIEVPLSVEYRQDGRGEIEIVSAIMPVGAHWKPVDVRDLPAALQRRLKLDCDHHAALARFNAETARKIDAAESKADL